ncbi:MAG: winged helix-turn-helix domain-containing protein [Thermoproteota archaeon]
MSIEALLGGRSRFAILEALAETGKPVTAYQIAMAKGLDPASTYRYLSEFLKFRVVDSERRRNQTFYRLSKGAGKAAVEYMQSLKRKASEPIDLQDWLSPEMQAERTAKIVRLDPDMIPFGKEAKAKQVAELLSKRAPRELAALVASSEAAFNELFDKRRDGTFTLKSK